MEASGNIRLLSDNVANKIAAGEVVERPASVLKELLENALDAGASAVDVSLEAAGRRAVIVADDGRGMERDDALLCIERHATSKIHEAEDMERVVTLGFRGEALAAISAVSRFSLTTRAAGNLAGTEITVSGGKLLDVRDAGCPKGTRVAVRNLFFNMPARQKFLRSNQTEQTHLRQTFLTYALGHPGVAMSLAVDGTESSRLAAATSLRNRIGELFDSDLASDLREVHVDQAGVRVTGLVGSSRMHRPDRTIQFFFINGRPAGAPVFSYALRSVYASRLPQDRHPIVFLFLETNPALVDVNVHPAKREVRFRRPMEVRDTLIRALEETIRGAAGGTQQVPLHEEDHDVECSVKPPPSTFDYPSLPLDAVNGSPDADARGESPPLSDTCDGTAGPWFACRLVGRTRGPYVILETEEGIILMDMRAAYERVLYERLMRQAQKGRVESQGLLSPETFRLSPKEALRIKRNLEVLRRMGFGISEFGGDTFLLDALPSCLGGGLGHDWLLEAAHAAEEDPRRGARWTEDFVARAACRAAAGGRGRLADDEIEGLATDLARTEMPYTCPHGRPTVLFMGFRELNRKFGREGRGISART